MTVLTFLKKKRIAAGCFISALIFVQYGVAAGSAQADSLVSAGNKYYMDREYNMAVESYSQVLKMGYEASSLFYNLGNAYYKLNNLPKAILFYEKARVLNPGMKTSGRIWLLPIRES